MLTDQANYQFMARYTIDQTTNATLGVFGIPTLTADMPTTGTASFEGFGEVSEVYVDALPGVRSTVIDHVASSTVDVNFLTNTVNAALQVSGALTPIGSQVDRLSARGMTLTGSSFSGGIINMFNNGERVYPNGTAANNSAAEQFYGAKRKADGTLTPAEVGGVIHSSSADGFVFGTFMAK
ncbi:hypothetical protein [Planktotalea sp.]|uniref:hypothetical protein n=1 Tax=Planktotalea sp. TaxID=2029877 RepID=UPI0025DB5126|nr:hypothetical protein [Planktotalea sp.]